MKLVYLALAIAAAALPATAQSPAGGEEVWIAYGLTGDVPFDEAEVQKLDSLVLAHLVDGGATATHAFGG